MMAEKESTMTATKTVLLVDDDEEILTRLGAALAARGYRVLKAADGNLGLALAEREAPDLVVVDMMVPLKSGLLILEKVKGRPHAPPVIMITANESPRHRAYAERLGADDYLCKPLDAERLLTSVQRFCPLPGPDSEG
jgi:DNA-binding response OmpR family regulator